MRTRTTEVTPGTGTDYTEWGLDYFQDLMDRGYDPYEGPNPYEGGLNFLQQNQVDNMTELGKLYGGPDGYWKKGQDIYGDVGAMSPDEVAAMNRSGGPEEGYLNPFSKYMKRHLKTDFDEALSRMKHKVGAGAEGTNAFGGSRQGVAEGVGGAKAIEGYNKATTGIDYDVWDKAMGYQREDYLDEINRVRDKNYFNLGFGGMRERAATSMSDITQPLSLIASQTEAGDKLRGYDASADMWDQEQYDKEQSWKIDILNDYMQGVSSGAWPQNTSQTQTGGQTQGEKNMGYAAIFFAKVMSKCIPEGTKIDTPDGPVAIEDIKAGTKVKGYYKAETEVLQVHQYKEDPSSHRFYRIAFDNGKAVDCCDMHKIYNKRAQDYKVGDRIQDHEITSITRHNGVERSYDLLTTDDGYLIGGIPVNSMIEELVELSMSFKSAA